MLLRLCGDLLLRLCNDGCVAVAVCVCVCVNRLEFSEEGLKALKMDMRGLRNEMAGQVAAAVSHDCWMAGGQVAAAVSHH